MKNTNDGVDAFIESHTYYHILLNVLAFGAQDLGDFDLLGSSACAMVAAER